MSDDVYQVSLIKTSKRQSIKNLLVFVEQINI
jgi:hypothetical protein